MKKIVIIALMMGLLPTAVFAAARVDQCALNSTCSFTIRGKFNKKFVTAGLRAGKSYSCSVLRGPGKLLTVKDIFVSKGVSFDLKGKRLNKPFIIHGPRKGKGRIRYTIYNHNDPWHTDNFQLKCKRVG